MEDRETKKKLADARQAGIESAKPPAGVGGDSTPVVRVRLERTERPRTEDQPLWIAIRNRTQAIGFERYREFIDVILCKEEAEVPRTTFKDPEPRRKSTELKSMVTGVGSYDLLQTATEIFLLMECGVLIDEKDLFNPSDFTAKLRTEAEQNQIDSERRRTGDATVTNPDIVAKLRAYLGSKIDKPEVLQLILPYLQRIRGQSFTDTKFVERPFCEGLLTARVAASTAPCLLELIWSYWHEEGMLVQSINAIALRFQNRLGPSDKNPLANFALDPLRPLSSLLWGYVQDEYKRLTVPRRAYEYDHHYGLALWGKAVGALRPADSRSKFLEAFHNLLYRTSVFYKQDDDTTVIADGFPVLQALREVHLLLAEGAHNQFGDLPWAARVEMLTQEWLLARPEMRDFLQGRLMVPYAEGWMSQVDTMKKLQNWTDTTVTHFRDLGVFGEQILLSVRYGDWIDVHEPEQASNWARYWRPEVQTYIHAYRAVTGVDLTAEPVDTTMPSVLLRNRLAPQAGAAPGAR